MARQDTTCCLGGRLVAAGPDFNCIAWVQCCTTLAAIHANHFQFAAFRALGGVELGQVVKGPGYRDEEDRHQAGHQGKAAHGSPDKSINKKTTKTLPGWFTNMAA